jgi:hypothetical protein
MALLPNGILLLFCVLLWTAGAADLSTPEGDRNRLMRSILDDPSQEKRDGFVRPQFSSNAVSSSNTCLILFALVYRTMYLLFTNFLC